MLIIEYLRKDVFLEPCARDVGAVHHMCPYPEAGVDDIVPRQ